MATLLEKLLRIPSGKVACNAPGFCAAGEEVRRQLHSVAEAFRYGYHAGLSDSGLDALAVQLERIVPESRGFAYEGAAMALDLLDQLKPWNSIRVAGLLRGPGAPHRYMVHVGVGWSIARLRWRIKARLSRLDPVLRWLALDGFGFHEGYFHWQRFAEGFHPPRALHGYGRRAFDQGLGRSLWFVAGADPERIAQSIASFPLSRHADLWSGVGLACAYAGGATADQMSRLLHLSGGFSSNLGQGAVFAVAAREHAGNPAAHTEVACRCLCGLPTQEAVAICAEKLEQAQEGANPTYETYEAWRRGIQMHFALQRRDVREEAEVYVR